MSSLLPDIGAKEIRKAMRMCARSFQAGLVATQKHFGTAAVEAAIGGHEPIDKLNAAIEEYVKTLSEK